MSDALEPPLPRAAEDNYTGRKSRAVSALKAGDVEASFELATSGLTIQIPGLSEAILDSAWRRADVVHELKEAANKSVKFKRLNFNKDVKVFPLKAHPGAITKVNLKFRQVYYWALERDPQHRRTRRLWSEYCQLFDGMANDEASAWLIELVAVGRDAILLLVLRRLEQLKTFVADLKGVGVSSLRVARLCEANVLQCRSAGGLDWEADISHRIGVAPSVAYEPEPEVLRREIRKILDEELPYVPAIKTLDDVWAARWANCKSGAHAKHIEKDLFGEVRTGVRPTRREFVESYSENVLIGARAQVLIGCSEKLEHKGARAIYNCDTVSYLRFDRLLAPVERTWKNAKALLRPEPSGHQRYVDSVNSSGAFFMLDFDDFNSSQSISSMKMVFEELENKLGVDMSWEISSFDNMKVNYEGELKKWVSSLPSGHRATSFINTILNAAYVRIWAGDLYGDVTPLHAGDDVLLLANEQTIGRLVDKSGEMMFRAQPSKQSAGTVSAEFLRATISGDRVFGYLPRALASLCSGNWTNTYQLDRREYVTSMLNAAWTIRNRCGRDLSECLRAEVRLRLPEVAHEVMDALGGRASMFGCPVYLPVGNDAKVYSMTVTYEDSSYEMGERLTYATQTYLDKFVPKKELTGAGVPIGILKNLMSQATYTPPARVQRKLRAFGERRMCLTGREWTPARRNRTPPSNLARVGEMVKERFGCVIARKFLRLCGIDQNTVEGLYVDPELSVAYVRDFVPFSMALVAGSAKSKLLPVRLPYQAYL